MTNMVLFNLRAAQPIRDAKRHGVGIYTEIVFRRIVERRLPLTCYYDGNNWLNPEIERLLQSNSIPLIDIRKKSLQNIVNDGSYKCLFSPSSSIEERSLKNIRVVTVQHDLRQYELLHDSLFWRYKNVTLKQRIKFLVSTFWKKAGYINHGSIGDHVKKNSALDVVTISYHSKAMISYFFPEIDSKKLYVFYSPSTIVNEVTETQYTGRYFLMVSGNRYEKNILRAIMALDILFSKGMLKDYKVKITGVKDRSTFRYKINNPNKFEFLGYVDDKDLHQLYHDAYCLLFPSLHEGFGYPPIEAMHYGVPVLASAISSIPEVCGDGAMYFCPLSTEDIISRIISITAPECHEKYSQFSKNRYKVITERQKRDLDSLIDLVYRNE